MDFHEIDTKGKLYIQRVTTLPVWAGADTSRIIYVTSEDAYYFATASGWSLWGSDIIPAGTKMIFYQNTAPTGWTIDGTVADALIAVKGGSNAYNVNAGQLAGTWVHGNHSHTFSDSFSASHSHGVTHNHRWLDNRGSSADYTWESNGTTTFRLSNNYESTDAIVLHVTSGDGHSLRGKDFYTERFSGSTDSADASDTVSGTTGDAADTPTTYRPYAAITIVATKN